MGQNGTWDRSNGPKDLLRFTVTRSISAHFGEHDGTWTHLKSKDSRFCISAAPKEREQEDKEEQDRFETEKAKQENSPPCPIAARPQKAKVAGGAMVGPWRLESLCYFLLCFVCFVSFILTFLLFVVFLLFKTIFDCELNPHSPGVITLGPGWPKLRLGELCVRSVTQDQKFSSASLCFCFCSTFVDFAKQTNFLCVAGGSKLETKTFSIELNIIRIELEFRLNRI